MEKNNQIKDKLWPVDRTNFDRNLAVVIGIDRYENSSIHDLSTPVSDAIALADLLENGYGYKPENVLRLVDGQANLNGLRTLLTNTLPNQLKPTEGDRVIFYFAGHGLRKSSKEGPTGYLAPQDAQPNQKDSFLPMEELVDALNKLQCHHLLVILDCCFAGTFRWAGSRKLIAELEAIHREHYDRFIRFPAWQLITSSAHDQEAFDIADELSKDPRGKVDDRSHSPFALALLEALQDSEPDSRGRRYHKADYTKDGVVAASELFVYLRERVSQLSHERQVPGLYPLKREYDKGEFIFVKPDFDSQQLSPAPELNKENNPYRGLIPFEERHAQFFFGRQKLVEELSDRLAKSCCPLTVVLGISGSGKSSLVKAGLLNHLRQTQGKEESAQRWYILAPMRPGKSPFEELAKAFLPVAHSHLIDRLAQVSFLDATMAAILDPRSPHKPKHDIREQPSGDKAFKVTNLEQLWHTATREAKLLLIVDYFQQLKKDFCDQPHEQDELSQLHEEINNALKPLAQTLQLNPESLGEAIAKWSHEHPHTKVLLVIDQLEELEKEWQRFLPLLTKTLEKCRQQLHVIVTLRSDFEPRFVNPDLEAHCSLFPVRGMGTDELRDAIEGPALKHALYFEPPELVGKFIDEVGQMPGALPLLSFTLSELYIKLYERWIKEGGTDRALRIKDYEDLRGVAGALTRRASQEYDKLGKAHQATMRRVMLRMVTIEGGGVARRRVLESEFVYPDPEENKRVAYVINDLVNNARLLVKGQETGEPYVEPAHDILVRGWDSLQKWLEEEGDKDLTVTLKRRLTAAAAEWNNVRNEDKEQPKEIIDKADIPLEWLGRKLLTSKDLVNRIPVQLAQMLRPSQNQQRQSRKKPVELWNESPYLDILDQKRKSNDNWFNQVETEFVQASVLQKRRNISLRMRIVTAVVVGLSGLTIWAFIGQRDTQIAQIRNLRQSSEVKRKSNQELEALLDVLQIGKLLDNWLLHSFKPDAEIKQLRRTLPKVVYTVQELNRLERQGGSVMLVDFQSTPNGEMIVTRDHAGIAVWHLDGRLEKEYTMKEVKDISKQSDGDLYKTLVHSFLHPVSDLSPDGKMLARGDQDGKVVVCNSDGALCKTFKAHNRAFNKFIMTVRFSPDSQMIATGTWGNEVKLWKLDGTPYKTLEGHSASVNALDFSRDGLIIASASSDKTVKLWNRGGTLLKTLEGHKGEVWGVSISPDSQMIASASADGTVKLWNRAGTLLKTLEGHRDTVRAVRFSADGHILASGSDDKTVKLWKLGGTPLTILDGNTDVVYTVRFNPDGKTIATTSGQGYVTLWQKDGTLLKPAKQQDQYGPVTALEFSPDGDLIVSAASDRTVRLSRSDGSGRKCLAGHTGETQLKEVQSVSFSPDSQIFAVGDVAGKIEIWNRDGTLKQTFPGHNRTVSGLSYSPDGQILASASWDGAVKLWNKDGSFRQTLRGQGSSLFGVAFSPDKQPDNQVIAAASEDGTVKLWKRDGTELEPLKGHSKRVRAVAFSPSGQLIATASYDKTVKLWKRDGTFLKTFYGHEDQVNAVAFSSDGKILASASNDKTVNLWNLDLDLDVGGLRNYTCDWMRGYLQNNYNVEKNDRHLCDGLGTRK